MRAAIILMLGLALAACTSSGSAPRSSPAASSSSSSSSSPARSSSTAAPSLYLSVGDSYAAGYQPGAGTNTNGFAYRVAALSHLQLTNVACSGATTASVLERSGCPTALRGPGAAAYDGRTQAAAAEAFLRAHPGQVALITVSLGGNDITSCDRAADAASCLTATLATAKTNLTTLLGRLRAAAGPSTRIVGITYPDILLGNYLSADPTVKSTAALSILAFRQLINPALAAAYASAGARFVDVTAATGAYTPLSTTTTLAPYGTIPVAVAQVCRLTYFCERQDIHPRTAGYALIARLVVAAR